MANILEDSHLHAKLHGGDMIAQDALYHRNCLLDLCYKASCAQLEGHYTDEERKRHGIAFGEVVSFMKETIDNSAEVLPVFKLSDLIKLYNQCLNTLGVTVETRIHSTRFKKRLLSQYMSAHNDGKEVILLLNSNIGEVTKTAASINYDEDGYILAKGAGILRRLVILLIYFIFHGPYLIAQWRDN